MVTATAASLEIAGSGPVTLVVHVGGESPRIVLARAAAAGVRVLGWPRGGDIVVSGDARHVRAAFGRFMSRQNVSLCGGI